jgi:hypothetical protein
MAVGDLETRRVLSKIADWMERQAARHLKSAENERFISLREAYFFDAKNYLAMVKEARDALAKDVT